MTDLVHVGGLTFDGNGVGQWVYQSLDGWKSSAPMRGDVTDRSNSDGAFGSLKNYRSAKTMTLVASLIGDSEESAEVLSDSFAAIQADGVPFLLSVETDRGIRSQIVTLSGVADVQEIVDLPGAAVTAQFIAYDPIKYGPSTDSLTGLPTAGGGLEYALFNGGSGGALYYGALGNLGRVTVTNEGTADVWPTFTVTGQLDAGFYIRCLETGDILRYDRLVPAGTSVSLDSRTGEVLIDGISDASTYLTLDNWFPIPAKGSCTIQFNSLGTSSGSPTLTVTSAPGWW